MNYLLFVLDILTISFFKVLSMDLWKTYLQYVKETKQNLSTFKEKMAQAYDFALDKMGLDISSNSLWSDYINFLKVCILVDIKARP